MSSKIAKIYKIFDNTNGNIYYGSTIQALSRRMSHHRDNYKNYLNGKYRYVTSFEIIKNGNYCISLVEQFEYETKEQMLARERYYIENNECVNKVIPGRTKKEYYEDNIEKMKLYHKQYRQVNREKRNEQKKEYYEFNKEKILEKKKEYYETNKEKINERTKQYRQDNKEKLKEYDKQYYEANKEKINERRKEKKECPICGCIVNKWCIRRHQRTDKCRSYIQV